MLHGINTIKTVCHCNKHRTQRYECAYLYAQRNEATKANKAYILNRLFSLHLSIHFPLPSAFRSLYSPVYFSSYMLFVFSTLLHLAQSGILK